MKNILKLYKEMSELTAPLCEKKCRGPQKCCSSEYCEMTIEHAKLHYRIILGRTDHSSFPLMGPKGCTADPHLRPLCTVHVCEYTLSSQSKELQDQYYALREEISENDISLR